MLFEFDQCVDDAIEQLLRATVTQVQNSLPSDPIVNRETYADQRNSQLPRDRISFAVSDQEVRPIIVLLLLLWT